ncbi:hypothetical protein [Rathayibacter soli]|uniref:hypothetical protein n=1 Tax=Rathayibacter soli TaxID=3144168 RepID=UPI0027E439DB|nr:hypothetical protein [Glaciibacter superstes]
MTDLWGVAIPGWVGAIGGSASAIVAVLAWIQSLRNKKTGEVLSGTYNEQAQRPEAESAAQSATAPTELGNRGETVANASTPYFPVTWGVERAGRRYRLVNRSTAHAARVLALDDVSDGQRNALHVDLALPVALEPGASMPFVIEKSLVGASVIALKITWQEADANARSVTLFV